ncbi:MULTISPECIES: hypothetical protein [Marinobacter]|uniref:TIGR04219 family outer membrane beta-barrel protein n=1 Tax=Marinobacter xiaoshiensis TaxID=3073652 RepID=A0ABU2HJF6_9GAMM|nr:MULTISPECIES: hypothetical protein [unclassified Marinobacter]MBK1888299.1 hypothetical protein [Marinobacter sp. DY40_1A1]MDS1310775.1 hypothetical protein [Marinobacter sp. F60267]
MTIKKLLPITFAFVAIGTALASTPAYSATLDARTTPPDRGMLQLGALFVFDSDTTFSASGSNLGLGTTIDFEEDLDGDSAITTPTLEFYYRFTDHHRIELGAFQLERKGSQVLNRSFTFKDRTFSTSNQVDSRIQNNIYKLAYGYSFYHLDKVELAISAGLTVLDYEVELVSAVGGITEAASTTAPMPVFGFRMDYSVTPRLTARFRTDSFYFDFEDKVRGSLLDIQVGLEYRALDSFALGASLSRLAIAVDVNDTKFKGRVDDLYRGARLYGAFFF